MEITLEKKPVVTTKEAVATELKINPSDVTEIPENIDPQIVEQADNLVKQLLEIKEKDLTQKEEYARAIQKLGQPLQADLAKQSQMLKAPVATIMKDAEDGGAVARDLLSLQEKVNEINPNRVDFTMGTIRRLFSKLPGLGTPLARWFAKYQAVDSVINDIIGSLKDGRAQLERDSNTLRDDQIRMRELTFKLQDYVSLAQVMDTKLTDVVSSATLDESRKKFIEEEILFPLKQRIMDLQQQLAVNQQGVLATEVIIRNNKELVNGVNRALNVTVTALNTAATLQIALQHQKKVLQGVEAVTDTTNDLIAGTAEQLKTQGTEIQKRAATTQLDIETLKTAFLNVQSALDDISEFRRNALPQMAQSIVEMDDVTNKMEDKIQQLEKGNEKSEEFVFEVVQRDEK